MGLEPTYNSATSCRLDQLGNRPKKVVGEVGFEPTLSCFQSRPEYPGFRTPRWSSGEAQAIRSIAVAVDGGRSAFGGIGCGDRI